MSQVSGQCPSRCDAPHGVPSAALDPAQTMSLLPGLEVARSTHPVEASSEEGFPEEAAPSMPHDSGLGAQQALNSIDLDVPTEAVTSSREPPRLHPTTAKWLQPRPPLRTGQCRACGERCSGRVQGPPEVADASISGQPGWKEKQRQRPVSLTGPSPGTGRLLRPLHTVLSIL